MTKDPHQLAVTKMAALSVYNNTSEIAGDTIAPPSQKDNDYDNFDLAMGVWLPAIVCTLGIIGNALSLVVLSRDGNRNVTFVSLQALASSDIILLIGALFQQVIPMYCITTASVHSFCRLQGYIRVYTWPIVCISQMTSIWITMLISAERFVAICFPLRASRMCILSRIRLAIIAIFLFAGIFNIPKFFEFKPEIEYREAYNLTFVVMGNTPLRTNTTYRYLYNTALNFLIMYAFPMTILTGLNVRIVREIKKARMNWAVLNRKRKKEMKATVLPLVIVIVYFVSGTQSLIAFVLDAIFVTYYRWLQVYTAIVNLLVILNSAVNFILMYLFGKKFRQMMADMFRCRGKRSRKRDTISSGGTSWTEI